MATHTDSKRTSRSHVTQHVERFDPHTGSKSVATERLYGERLPHANIAVLRRVSGRPSAAEREEAAARMATLTESYEIVTDSPNDRWVVTYTTTHRIVPIDADGEV